MARLMPQVDRLYVDANVFILLFEGSGELSDHLAELFSSVRSGREPFLATSELTVAELLVDPYRRKDDELIQIYDNWTITNDHLTVGPIGRDVLWYAAVLRSQYNSLKLPDAIHLSAAVGLRCSHVLRADKRLNDQYELTHHRFGRVRGPVRLDILRPEIEVIRGLTEGAAQ
jgi:predicted nucleic acid-binding protein